MNRKVFLRSAYVFVSAVVLAVVASGCNNNNDDDYQVVDSPGVPTGSVFAEIHVSYTGSQVVAVEATLREEARDSNTDINLIPGDALQASTVGDPADLSFGDNLYDRLLELSSQIKTLQRGVRRVHNDIVSGIWYYAATDAKYRHKEFTVSLLRNNQNDAHSVVRLPPDIILSVDELANNSVLSRSAPLTVRWSPASAGYSMEVSVFLNCDDVTGEWSSGAFNNPVNQAIDSYEIAADILAGYGGDCIVTIGVESSSLGRADPALHPSSFIQGHQYRTVAIATIE